LRASGASPARIGCGGGPAGDFISDNPKASSNDSEGNTSGSGGGSDGAEPSSGPSSADDAKRAITEADIIQVKDNKLYALSRFSGLSIDVSDPSSPGRA
jgi:hypothetical protein